MNRMDLARPRRVCGAVPAGGVLAVGLFALGWAACDDFDFAFSTDGSLAVGTWGGEDAGVLVTEGNIHIHIGCTFGDIVGEIPLDDDGRFTVDGTYVLRAFPIQTGPPLPAQFVGHVEGRRLTLAVAVNDTVQGEVVALGPVEVVYGMEPSMQNCPICRVPEPGDSLVPDPYPNWGGSLGGGGGGGSPVSQSIRSRAWTTQLWMRTIQSSSGPSR